MAISGSHGEGLSMLPISGRLFSGFFGFSALGVHAQPRLDFRRTAPRRRWRFVVNALHDVREAFQAVNVGPANCLRQVIVQDRIEEPAHRPTFINVDLDAVPDSSGHAPRSTAFTFADE